MNLLILMILTSSKLVFPQVEITLKPGPEDGKDAYINTFYTSGNGSTQSFIASAWTYGGIEGIGRSFIQFNLPELPLNYNNFSAHINLYYDYSSLHVGHGGENASRLERITQDWNEFGIDWYNQPSVDPSDAVVLPTSETTDQDYPDIDVTQLVLNMYSEPDQSFGFRLSLLDEEIYRSMILASSDHPDEMVRPSLVLRYDTCTLPKNTFSYETDFRNCQFYYNDTSVTSWNWDFGNGYGSNLQNPIYYFNEPGTYYVCLQVENTCGTLLICDSVKICDELEPDFSFVVNEMDVIFSNLTQGGNSYFWDFGNGFFSFLENPEFQYNEAGEYSVCLSVSNECNTSTTCKTITVSSTTITNFNDFNSCDFESRVKLYPNPASEEVLINSRGITIYQIELIDCTGATADKIHLENIQDEYRLSLQGRTPGFYLLRITTESGILTKKIIILN